MDGRNENTESQIVNILRDSCRGGVGCKCTLNSAADKIDRLRGALCRIVRWHGEFPDSGRQWADGRAMSYGAAFGSNGERDYMRQVALNALGPNE